MTTRMTTTGHDLILRDVTFAYGPHAEPVLRNLNLTVREGDHLAIVGPSGIGKSTLAGLLCGLLLPDSGTVALGDTIVSELAPERLAEIRTLIPQEAYVFAGTVWDNLTYLCSTATTRQVENAVAALGGQQLVARLGGIGAELTPTGLSAGERQLVALVRAYISAAPVVVLDEATCHLDPPAERRAEEAFAARAGTLIVIAHRISSALRARRILVLDGTDAAVGDHQTLLSTSPLYRELLGHWQGRPTDAAKTSGHPVPARRTIPRGEQMARPVESATSAGLPPWPAATATASTPMTRAAEPAGAGQDPRLLIFGQVTQGRNTPLTGATVTLTDLSGSQLDRDSADAGGHYRLHPPSRGSYLVICASAAHQPIAAMVALGEAPVRHDVLLSGAQAGLSGTVRQAESGTPLAGAVVTLIDTHGDVAGVVATDEQGRFGFAELTQGHYTLTVAAELLQPVARGVEIPADGQVTMDVEVAARVQLAGVVRTATGGQAVPEALATLISANGQVVGSVITDASGGFTFDDLPAGMYTLIATGYPPVAAEVMVSMGAPITETVITLWPPTPDSHAMDSHTAENSPTPDSAAPAPGPFQSVMTAGNDPLEIGVGGSNGNGRRNGDEPGSH